MKTAKLFYRASLLSAHTDCQAGPQPVRRGCKKRADRNAMRRTGTIRGNRALFFKMRRFVSILGNRGKRVAVGFQSFQMARSSKFGETRSRR
jgi:hypothetical protein